MGARRTTDRGYGYQHVKERAQLKRTIDRDGYICARCHQYAPPGSAFHYDHTDDRTGYLGASHPFCNEQAAGRKARARDKTRTRSRLW